MLSKRSNITTSRRDSSLKATAGGVRHSIFQFGVSAIRLRNTDFIGNKQNGRTKQ
ncbi:hypothetical protein QFZ80_003080 [Paenibacillus sp. V4I7]|nr:hypothetical protein [Paenibacillus sp. V4I7]MDQ0914758.1 hypothetical protein [Paenibacillus sp. V4I5]